MSLSAEPPKPPEDGELRNIIDKLAQFVARNGPEFENMTKQKQKDNPRFGFLFGGEYFHYYMYKVNAEQAIMRKQKLQAEQASLNQIQALQQQISESERNLKLQHDVLMQEQQHQVEEAIRIAEHDHLRQVAEELKINFDDFSLTLEQMQLSCTKEAISANKNWFFNHYSSQRHAEIILSYLVNRIKDPSTPFLFKLHLLYLVNDLTHHYCSVRKQNDAMLNLLNRFVVIMFCCVYKLHSSDEQQKEKLEKLRSIWETQRYFPDEVLKKLSNVQDTAVEYMDSLKKEYTSTVAEIKGKFLSQYHQYELQHLEYAKHIQQQISNLEGHQRPTFPPANQPIPSLPRGLLGTAPPPNMGGTAGGGSPGQMQQRRSRFDTGPMPTSQPPPGVLPPNVAQVGFPPLGQNVQLSLSGQAPPPQVSPWQQGPPPGSGPPPFNARAPPPQLQGVPPHRYDFPQFSPNRNVPPPGMPPPMNVQPRPLFPPGSSAAGGRFSGPPPMGGPVPWNPQIGPPPGAGAPIGPPPGGQTPWPTAQGPVRTVAPQNVPPVRLLPPPEDVSLIPKVAYYDLPAGLMAPLVTLKDNDYKPIDPSKIRLPPPMPPNDRLLAAVEAFYAPPNHENPRDSEGWERLGLYEYYKAKQNAIQMSREGDVDDNDKRPSGDDSQRRPPTKRRSRSYSHSESRSRSRSRTYSRSRSRSADSRRSRRSSRSSRTRSSSRSRSRSRSDSRSPRRRARSGSNSDSRSPPRHDRRRGGETTTDSTTEGDASTAYQGLGAPSGDPFEDFRKAQSGMFLQRIRSAAEHR